MRWAARLIFLGLFGYLAIVAIAACWWPMGVDQGIFAWVGDVILQAGLPYRDAWEVKGPATHYTFALSQWMFGRNFWGIRLLDLGLLALALIALRRILRQTAGPLAGHFGVLLFAFYYLGHGHWNTAQPDGWASMLLLLALALLLEPRPVGPGRRAGAGLLAGLATLYKPTFLAFLLPLAVFEALGPARSQRERLLRGVSLAVASLAVLGACALWFAWQGALAELLEIQLRFNLAIHQPVQQRPLPIQLKLLWAVLAQPLLALHSPLMALGVFRAGRRHRPLLAALLLFLLVTLGLVVLQNKHYPYHWMPLYGPLTILAGLGLAELERLARRLAGGWSGRADLGKAAALVAVVVMLVPALPPPNLAGWSTFVFGTLTPERYYMRFASAPRGGFSPLLDLKVSEYLRRRTAPDDSILVWGFEPVVHFLSGRRAPTRFGFSYALIVSQGTEFYHRYRQEFLRDLRAHAPAYIVIMDLDYTSLAAKTSAQYFREFPEFVAFVKQGYAFDRNIGHFHLWRSRSHRPAAGATK